MKKLLFILALLLSHSSVADDGATTTIWTDAGASAVVGLEEKIDKPIDPLDAGKFLQVNPAGDDVEFVDTTHFKDSSSLSGVVAGDSLMSDMAVGQAYHFQATSAVTLDSANDIITLIDTVLSIGPAPLAIPSGTQGYLSKNASGQISVVYTTSITEPHALDFSSGSGNIDVDVLLGDMEIGQAFTYHALFGDAIFTSANVMGEIVDNLAQSGANTVTVPAGTIAQLVKNSAGNINVHYTTKPLETVITSVDGTVEINTTTETDLSINACAVNDYINNIEDYYLDISYEAAGGAGVTIKVNDIDAAYENLVNATDGGNGRVTFTGGANQNYNRRARVSGTVLREVGDKVEISATSINSFSTMFLSLSPDVNQVAHTFSGQHRLRFATGQNPNNGNHSFFDSENTAVFPATGGTTGTFTITRTLSGFKLERNDVEFYQDTTECETYSEDNNFVSTSTGQYRIAEHVPVSPINTSTASLTNIDTGFDLTQSSGMTLRILFADQGSGIPWTWSEIDVDELLRNYNAGSTVDTYVHIHTNDWERIEVQDPVLGIIGILDVDRDMAYVKSELWITAPNESPLFELANVATITTTGTFQNVGDSDARITGEDGDKVYIEYGDGTRDSFTFLDGVAREDRKVGGSTDSELELQVVSGQLQIKHNSNASGINNLWYEQHIDAGVINTGTSGVSTDANNSLSLGADSLPFYEDVDTVSSATISGARTNTLTHSDGDGNSEVYTPRLNGLSAGLQELNSVDSDVLLIKDITDLDMGFTLPFVADGTDARLPATITDPALLTLASEGVVFTTVNEAEGYEFKSLANGAWEISTYSPKVTLNNGVGLGVQVFDDAYLAANVGGGVIQYAQVTESYTNNDLVPVVWSGTYRTHISLRAAAGNSIVSRVDADATSSGGSTAGTGTMVDTFGYPTPTVKTVSPAPITISFNIFVPVGATRSFVFNHTLDVQDYVASGAGLLPAQVRIGSHTFNSTVSRSQ